MFLAVIFLLALPIWFSALKGDNTSTTPFATIAFAGHTSMGNFCDCGAPGCICDPGEEQTAHSKNPAKDPSPERDQRPKPDATSDLNFGSAAFLLGLALFMWSRFRG